MKSRIILLFSFFLILWSILLVRAARLQIFPDERLENLKRRQFETSLQIHTRRGAIVDRSGTELAASIPAFSLFADPKVITDPYGLAKRLGKYLDQSPVSLKKMPSILPIRPDGASATSYIAIMWPSRFSSATSVLSSA